MAMIKLLSFPPFFDSVELEMRTMEGPMVCSSPQAHLTSSMDQIAIPSDIRPVGNSIAWSSGRPGPPPDMGEIQYILSACAPHCPADCSVPGPLGLPKDCPHHDISHRPIFIVKMVGKMD